MPRKSPDQLKAKAPSATASASVDKPVETTTSTAPASAAAPTVTAPIVTPAPHAVVATPTASTYHPADYNGDGKVDGEEKEMYLEFKRKEFEDADAMRDAQRKMAWFALGGMLLYPFAVVLAVAFSLEQAGKILGDMAATYFVSVAAIVAAFFGGQAFTQSKKK